MIIDPDDPFGGELPTPPKKPLTTAERRARSYAQPKCACGNCLSPGKTQCSACEPVEDWEFEMLRDTLQSIAADGVHDEKIVEYLQDLLNFVERRLL